MMGAYHFGRWAGDAYKKDPSGGALLKELPQEAILAAIPALRVGPIKRRIMGQVAKAEALESVGASLDKIWQKTGLARSKDGKWVFELSYDGFTVEPYAGKRLGDGSYQATLAEHYPHPKLYKYFPEFGQMQSRLRVGPKVWPEAYYEPWEIKKAFGSK